MLFLVRSTGLAVLSVLAFTASASGATPFKITVEASKALVGAPVTMGPGGSIHVTHHIRKHQPTQIISDCDGAIALGFMPKYHKRVYNRNSIATSTCFAREQYDELPVLNRWSRRDVTRLKVKAEKKICRYVANAGRRGQPKHKRVRIPCIYLDSASSNGVVSVVRYRKGKIKKVTLRHMMYPDTKTPIPHVGEIRVYLRNFNAVGKFPYRML